ncbi:class I SAM-dependent methyltransferase [Dokdonella sp.]|uniref:class I SAM-dependent methyltransferase n=1 Tax=Dokdonella sp. TaxID=2291710 RepID=UPI002D8012D2|nr:class I SAM-dependent methyltransferase [Dokdonella sp.]
MDMFAIGKMADALELIDGFSPSSTTQSICLDIGCGIGISHPLMAPHVGSLAGTDVSGEAIETARAANPDVDYRIYDGERLPYDDASFDFSSTVCVMHHVPPAQWSTFVAEAFRVTKPEGLFAVYEHNPINPMTRWAVWRCPFDHDAVLLRARRTQALLREAGFEIVVRRYLFFVPIDRSWARRFDKLLRWLPLGAQYVVCGRRPRANSAGTQNPS